MAKRRLVRLLVVQEEMVPIYTYVRNAESHDDTDRIELRGGSLVIGMGEYANLTEEEIREVKNNTSGCIIEEGIVGNAVNAE